MLNVIEDDPVREVLCIERNWDALREIALYKFILNLTLTRRFITTIVSTAKISDNDSGSNEATTVVGLFMD